MSNVSGWLPNLLGPVEVQDNGTAVTARAAINFIGCTIVDNEADDSTDITPPATAIVITGTPAVGNVPRATSTTTAAWGALDLADTDAVTGVLPTGNVATTLTSKTLTNPVINGQTQGASSAISALAIDWSLSGVFTKTLAAGANTFTFSNATDGQCIIVVVTGAASTVTWPTVKWAAGAAPTQTASGTDVYTFVKAGSTIFGSVVQAMA